MTRSKWYIAGIALCVNVFNLPSASFAQAPPAAESQRADVLDELFEKIVLEVIPRHWEDRSDWGMTKEFTTGLKISRDGLRIKTKRRRKPLNHGSWEYVRVDLLHPERFVLNVHNVRSGEGGKINFDVEVVAPLLVVARRSKWQRGVQLYSVSAEADALVRLVLHCTTGMTVSVKLPPSVALQPKITGAEIQLADFRLRRLSKIGGEIASELGRAARGRLERRLAREDDRLVQKINAKIADNQDKLNLSLALLAASQFRQLGDLLKDNHAPGETATAE